MRPTKETRNAFEYPLDYILGSPALIRVLRVAIYEVRGAISVTQAARLAGVTQAGARRAFERLQSMGVVRRVGSGRALAYEVVLENPLVGSLALLFDNEDSHYHMLLSELRTDLSSPAVIRAWVDDFPNTLIEPLPINIVVTPERFSGAAAWMQKRLSLLERTYRITIELNIYLEVDEPEMPKDALLLWGTPQLVEAPSSRLGRDSVLEFLAENPSAIPRAKKYLERMLEDHHGMAAADLREWLDILERYSPEQVIGLLLSNSERSLRLWRSEPFLAILTPAERKRLQEKKS